MKPEAEPVRGLNAEVDPAMDSGPQPPAATADRGLAIVVHAVFVLSGLAALIYQTAWQRSLMQIYGSTVESVAMVVASFMAGLGLGSLAGGAVSKMRGSNLVLLFSAAELGIGLFGFVSLRLFHWVGAVTLEAGLLETGLISFALVLFPTLLMGATLPVLVAYRVACTREVGRSVGWLYFVNTLGGGLGAFFAAFYSLGHLGLSGSCKLAAGLNFTSAAAVLALWRVRR